MANFCNLNGSRFPGMAECIYMRHSTSTSFHCVIKLVSELESDGIPNRSYCYFWTIL